MLKILLLIFIIFPVGGFAQMQEKVEVLPQILSKNLSKDCKVLELGEILFFYQPDYPENMQYLQGGGTVNVQIKVDADGTVKEISKADGNKNFTKIAENAVQKMKFSPTLCDGKAIPVSAQITYNFIPKIKNQPYFFPTSTKDFTDVEKTSPFYESIENLTDNYKISFGYSDNRFYENSPLTRGELAQFLVLTLDVLFKRAKESKKIPLEIKLVKSFNPQNLQSVNSIKDMDQAQPFYRPVAVLLQTYNIAPVDENSNFQGKKPVTKNELIDIWTNIFGFEAVPVNFEKSKNDELIFTRGEFALFLNESMQVLSYKVLP